MQAASRQSDGVKAGELGSWSVVLLVLSVALEWISSLPRLNTVVGSGSLEAATEPATEPADSGI